MTVSLLVEIPEPLHQSIQNYLEQFPTCDQDELFTTAIALFLQSQPHSGRKAA